MFRKILPLLLIASLVLTVRSTTAAQGIGALELTATYTSPDETFGFRYPGGWVTQDLGQIVMLATDRTVLDAGTVIGRGQMRASLVAAPIASLNNLSAGSTLDDVMQTLMTGASQTQSAQSCQPYQPATAVTFGDHAGLRSSQLCTTTENLFLVVDLGSGSVGVVAASSVLGGMTKFGATLEAVAASMTLAVQATGPQADVTAEASVLEQSYISAITGISLRYPAHWRIEERSGGLIGLTDGSQPMFPNPPPGQTTVVLTVFALGEIPAFSATPADVARWYAGTLVTDLKYGEPESFLVDGAPAARMLVNVRGIDGMLFVLSLPDGSSAVMSVYAPPGSLSDVAPVVYAIAASIRTAVSVAPTFAPFSSATPVVTETLPPTVAGTATETEPPTLAPSAILVPTEPPTATLAPTEAATATLAPSATPQPPTTTVQPTEPPAQPPTATHAPTEPPTPAIDLPQTYSELDGSLSFRYPAGWRAFHQNVGGTDFLIVASADPFTFGPPPAGQPFGIVLVSSLRQVTGKPPSADEAQRPIDALNALIATSGGAPFGPPVGFEVDGRAAARSTAAYPSFDNTTFIVMLDDDRYAYLNAFAAPGETDALAPTLLAILASVSAP